jgi:hypothetical protein
VIVAKQFTAIETAHREFIDRQRVFFTASATGESRINISPRSTDYFRLLDNHSVAYLDRTGSGNETAAHVRADGRLTIMFCAFEGPPMILRLYGRANVCHRDQRDYAELIESSFGGLAPPGARQIIRLGVELVQTSCGFGVPLLNYNGERDTLDRWTEAKGRNGIEAYWREKNRVSIDGLPTGLVDVPEEDLRS